MEEVIKHISKINFAKRWDYRFHQRKFSDLEQKLDASIYPLYFVEQITNQVIDGTHFTPQYTDNSGVLFLMTRNVRPHEIILNDVSYITHEEHQKLIRCKPEPGDVLVTKDGTIGIAAVVPDTLPEFNIFVSLIKIRPKSVISPHYLAAFINSELGQLQIKQQIKGAAITHIHLEDMRRIRIPIPPRSLQDQIAQVMQEAYGDRQKKREKAKKLLNSSSRVVLEELDLEISELKDEKYFTVSISKIAGGRLDLDLYNTCYTGLIKLLQEKFDSTLTPLKAISHQITSGATPLGSKYFESGVAFLRVQNLNDKGEIDFDDCLFVSEEFAKTLKRATIQNGDILLVIVGATIGKSAVVKDIEHPLVTNQALARIRIRETVDLLPEFLQAFLNSPVGQIQISSLKRPVAQGNLSLTETGQILVPIIPLSQQEKVISRVQAYCSEANRLLNEAEAVVDAAKARVERMILGEDTVE